MVIDEGALIHWIEYFYGYGSWDARIWFVSHEESGGEVREEVAGRINYFRETQGTVKAPALCDIRELYRHVAFKADGPRAALFSDLYDYRFGEQAVIHGLWKNLIAFVHGYQGNRLPDLLSYQKNSFLSHATHQELLIPLYPLPAQNDHAWYYSWLDLPRLPFLTSRNAYQEQLYPHRIHSILQRIRHHKPAVVLMYGMENINRLKDSVREAFPKAKFSLTKAVPLKIPTYHRADLEDTTLLLTTQIPALHHRRAETGFDWLEFGSIARETT